MSDKINRRGFIRGAAVAGAAAGTLAAPSIARAETTVLKLQSAWGGEYFMKIPRTM
ncbi:MAG: twin-arginine translocation signal domain-containing protein [Rhodobacteraceae bacterium]|nr:twin-arginine translocation signal domain-containing protein [Paracoccaceae bacterium]